MLTTEEKLSHFSQSVFARAQKQADTIIKAAQQAAQEQTDAFESRCLDHAYHTIQVQTRKIRRQAQEGVARQKLAVRRELFKNREAMVEAVFSDVTERLTSFRADSGYIDFLKQAIAKAETLLGTQVLNIVIDAADVTHLATLQTQYPQAQFSLNETAKTLPGGIYATDVKAGRTADFSLETLLCEEKTRFLTESGFTL